MNPTNSKRKFRAPNYRNRSYSNDLGEKILGRSHRRSPLHDGSPPHSSSVGNRSNSHWGHDDRLGGPSRIDVGHGEIRRVKFKNSQKKTNKNIRSLTLDDIDSDMISAVSSFGDLSMADKKDQKEEVREKVVERVGRMESFVRNRGIKFRFELKRYYSWYKVTVLRGAQFEQNELLEYLVSVVPQTCLSSVFIKPYKFEKVGLNATFYVGEFRVALDLLKTSGKITDRDGEKVIVKVNESFPEIVLSITDKEAIKAVCCAKRYDALTKTLDLSRFHDDPDLRSVDIFIPLSESNLLVEVIRTVREVIPDLHALNLSHNKMFTFPAAPMLQDMMPNLQKLNVESNKLAHIVSLKNLKNLGIEELQLDGNPLLWKVENQEAFQKELRKIFPNLKLLDNVALKPVFDTRAPVKLLPSQVTYFCDSTHQELVNQFIHQYFEIYDSDNRIQLLEAYDQTAQFSSSCHLPRHRDNERNMLCSHRNVEDYLGISRNLCKFKQVHQRIQRLYIGKESIVQCLCSLPKTQHDRSSFSVDLTISTPNLVSLTITGIFRERPSVSVPIILAFSRMFLVAICNGRCSIINELMFVGRPTTAQAKVAFKSQTVAGPSTSVTPNSTPVIVNPAELDIETKKGMVMRLAAETGMNLVYSDRCLCETGWNYEAAVLAFNTHKTLLPAEAFVK